MSRISHLISLVLIAGCGEAAPPPPMVQPSQDTPTIQINTEDTNKAKESLLKAEATASGECKDGNEIQSAVGLLRGIKPELPTERAKAAEVLSLLNGCRHTFYLEERFVFRKRGAVERRRSAEKFQEDNAAINLPMEVKTAGEDDTVITCTSDEMSLKNLGKVVSNMESFGFTRAVFISKSGSASFDLYPPTNPDIQAFRSLKKFGLARPPGFEPPVDMPEWREPEFACYVLADVGFFPSKRSENLFDPAGFLCGSRIEQVTGFFELNPEEFRVEGKDGRVELISISLRGESKKDLERVVRIATSLYERAIGFTLPEEVRSQLEKGTPIKWVSKEVTVQSEEALSPSGILMMKISLTP